MMILMISMMMRIMRISPESVLHGQTPVTPLELITRAKSAKNI